MRPSRGRALPSIQLRTDETGQGGCGRAVAGTLAVNLIITVDTGQWMSGTNWVGSSPHTTDHIACEYMFIHVVAGSCRSPGHPPTLDFGTQPTHPDPT